MEYYTGTHIDIDGVITQTMWVTKYDYIVRAFGTPTEGPDEDLGGNITCRWRIEFLDGTRAVIYDRSPYEHTVTDYPAEWYIGGDTRRAVDLVITAIFVKKMGG